MRVAVRPPRAREPTPRGTVGALGAVRGGAAFRWLLSVAMSVSTMTSDNEVIPSTRGN